jgi:hypothetical protein
MISPLSDLQKGQAMHFVLTGFRQSDHTRRYYFDAIEKEHERQQVTVSADVDLARRYGISLQELPLLCLRLLEGHRNAASISFAEPEMVRWAADKRAARAEVENRPARRRPISSSVAGQAWRSLPFTQAK